MWLPILGLVVGLLLGAIFSFSIPIVYANYLAIAVLAGLDSLLGGWRAVLEKDFDANILISGFFVNTILAAALAWLGDMLGLDLYLAAVIAFGIRIFKNIGAIRHGLIFQHREKLARKKELLALDYLNKETE